MAKRILSIHAAKSLQRLGQPSNIQLPPAQTLLKKWLLEHQLTVNQFAGMVCMNRRQLDAHLRGEFRSKGGYIQLHHAFAIEWATQGKVPAWLWLDQPAWERRIRESHHSWVKVFEQTAKRHILKWNSLRTVDGMLREKARVLSRLFNVQWSEVKSRLWLDAERMASEERADISHLMELEDNHETTDGVIYVEQEEAGDEQLSNEDWLAKYAK